MGNDERDEDAGQGNGQQGTGGLGNGRATSTPGQAGGQPHLGSAAHHSAQSAPGGTGETEGASEAGLTAPADHQELHAMDRARAAGTNASRHNDRLDAIELADDRTEALNPHRGAGATDPSADLDDALTGPASNRGYVSDAHRETPTLGAIDDDADNM